MSKDKKCMMCGKPSPDTICDSCKASVQAEAAGEKAKMERNVKVGGKMADKQSKQGS